MDGLNWLLGLVGAIVSIGVLVGAAWLGWRILRSTIDLLRTSARPSVWSLLYYVGVLMLIIVVVSIFIPLFFASLATGIRDSRESARDISIELNSWIIQSIDDAQQGNYGSFPTRERSVPYGQSGAGAPQVSPVPLPFSDPDFGGGHGVPPAVAVPTVQVVIPTPPVYPTMTPAPVFTLEPVPTVVPTLNLDDWNIQTPVPTPGRRPAG